MLHTDNRFIETRIRVLNFEDVFLRAFRVKVSFAVFMCLRISSSGNLPTEKIFYLKLINSNKTCKKSNHSQYHSICLTKLTISWIHFVSFVDSAKSIRVVKWNQIRCGYLKVLLRSVKVRGLFSPKVLSLGLTFVMQFSCNAFLLSFYYCSWFISAESKI